MLGIIAGRARRDGLAVLAAMHPAPGDGAPEGAGTLVLLGPAGRAWERAFAAGPEAGDGRPDPVDRWSRRVIGRMAADLGARALYPFDGPPWPPVIRWALASGWCHSSPVGMLVHPQAGLWFSCRGVLALAPAIALPPAARLPPVRPAAASPAAAPVRWRRWAAGATMSRHAWAIWAAPGARAALRWAARSGMPAPPARPSAPEPAQAARHMAAFLAGASGARPRGISGRGEKEG
ncbi:MAG: hypothetical protein KatS3mg118_2436 [Paracoccaceae bacterium]|nr:MAG: hypothetical protein KatS3mg118_2436 [Paracoccaceae bacterium]